MNNERMFLSDDDLREITGQRSQKDQIHWLQDRKILFELNRQGWPIVSRSWKETMLAAVDEEKPNLHLQKLGGLVTIEDINTAAIKAPIMAGVYLLLLRGEIIYIGQSQNILHRIGTHSRDIEFDHYTYIPCKPDKRWILERKLIRKFNPSLNVSGKLYDPIEIVEEPRGL